MERKQQSGFFSLTMLRTNKTVFSVYIVQIASLTALYFAAGKLESLLAISPDYMSVVSPAAGIALAAVILYGYRLWPGIWLGSLLINMGGNFNPFGLGTLEQSFSLGVILATGATLQAIVGGYLINRFMSAQRELVTTREIVAFLLLIGPISCLLGATWKIITLSSAHILPRDDVPLHWLTWWSSDIIGVVILTPIALVFLAEPKTFWKRRRWGISIPLCIVLVAIIGLNSYVFNQEHLKSILNGRPWVLGMLSIKIWFAISMC